MGESFGCFEFFQGVLSVWRVLGVWGLWGFWQVWGFWGLWGFSKPVTLTLRNQDKGSRICAPPPLPRLQTDILQPLHG